MLGILFNVLRRLSRELARRRKNKRARVAGAARLTDLDEMIQNGKHERRSLTRTRLGAADQIAALQQNGYRLFLNRGGGFVACIRNGVLKFLIELTENISFEHRLDPYIDGRMVARKGIEPLTLGL